MAITHATTTGPITSTQWNEAHSVTAADVPIVDAAADFTATEVEGALAELQADAEAHVAAADPHAGYRLESVAIAAADVAADVATQAELDAHAGAADPHTGYQLESGLPLAAWPIGSVFIAVVSTNPNTLLGGGTWAAIAVGRMLIGLDSGDAAMDTVEETGGAKTHTLTAAEMPAHVHREMRNATTTGAVSGPTTAPDTSSSNPQDWGTQDTGSTGGGGAHNNLPPYFVVYMWKRLS